MPDLNFLERKTESTWVPEQHSTVKYVYVAFFKKSLFIIVLLFFRQPRKFLLVWFMKNIK